MKSCAGADAAPEQRQNRASPARRRGFVLIYVLAVSAALISLLALALNTVQKTAEEDLAAARRLRRENIAAQASAAAEAWFYDSAAAIAEEAGFELDAAPESDPTPDVPEGIFAALRGQFPDYVIKCVCYDLHYPDSFSENAYAARIPRIPPRAADESGAVRAYYIRTTVSEAGDERYKTTVTLGMRVEKSPSGVISVRTAGVTE